MRIGLYFGSFNPVHIGHLIIASHVHNQVSCGQVWFVVTPQNPFKKQGTLLNENHRKRLLDLAIEHDFRFRTSSVEFHMPRPSYTIDTLVHLSDRYPEHEFFIILGSDAYSNIERWKNAEVLLRDYDLVVFERPGFPVEISRSRVTVLEQTPLLTISSTYVRSLISQKKSIQYLVPQEVADEIHAQHYYF